MSRMSVSVLLMAIIAIASVAQAKLLYPARPVPHGWTEVAPHSGKGKKPSSAAAVLHAPLTHVVTQQELSHTAIPILVGLHRNNVKLMDDAFWAVSDPSKADTYGHHVTSHDEMRTLVGANKKDIKDVKHWLATVVAPERMSSLVLSTHHDYISIDMSLAEVETLLSIKFRRYVETASGRHILRAVNSVHIPDHLAAIVQTISGYGGFPMATFKPRQQQRPIAGAVTVGSPQTNVTPALLYQVYNQSWFPTLPAGKRNIQSFFQAQGQNVNYTDLTVFCETLLGVKNCSITRNIGGNNSQNAGLESSLDSEYIMSTGHLSETWIWTFNNFDFCGDLMRFAMDVFQSTDGVHPHVISMSYGSQQLPNYCLGPDVHRLSEDTQKMGLMGVTVVIASGDDGSGETNRQSGFNFGYLSPSMPASMPFVTAVGSTTFVAGNNGQQMATTEFGSGGGFSTDYAQPVYQQSSVAHYFKTQTQLPPWITYNSSGRGTPDVSGLGEGYNVLSGGSWQSVGGTSCSTPMFAGMVTMLNNIRLKKNRHMGFINPFLYNVAAPVGGLTDIVAGNNDANGDGYGWYAAAGWDPATGLGTPNWGILAEQVAMLNSRDHGGDESVLKMKAFASRLATKKH